MLIYDDLLANDGQTFIHQKAQIETKGSFLLVSLRF